MSCLIFMLLALSAGLINGLLSSGGGMAALCLLKSQGLEERRCHATSLSAMTVLSAAALLLHIKNKTISPEEILPFLPGGLTGAFFGAFFLKKIPLRLLRALFAAALFWCGFRFLFK